MRYSRAFQIGEKEMVRFHFGRSLREKLPGMIGLSIAGMLIVYLYMTRMGLSITTGQLVLWMILGFVFVLAALSLGLYLSVLFSVRKGLKKQGFTRYEQAVNIDGFGIRVRANGKEAKLAFDKLFAVRETRQDFYLFVTDTQAWLLPKSQMEDAAAESALLRQIFSTVVESRKLRLRK